MARIGHSLIEATDQSSKCAIGKISNKTYIVSNIMGFVNTFLFLGDFDKEKGDLLCRGRLKKNSRSEMGCLRSSHSHSA